MLPCLVIALLVLPALPSAAAGSALNRPANTPPSALRRSCPTPGSPCLPTGVAAAAVPSASGVSWTNVTSLQRFSPPGLYGASLAFDPSDNYLVLFGGCSATACPVAAQTWKYAGGAWTVVAGSGPQPPARAFASMVDDSRDGYVLLFGGWAGPGHYLNDTWGFAGGTWTNLTNATTAPPARDNAAMAFDHADGYVVLFGGANSTGSPLADTWRFQLGQWKNETGTTGAAPPARQGGAMTWDDTDGYAVLFGGANASGALFGDTWQFAHGKWTAAVITSPTSPPARTDPVLTYYGSNNAAFLVGGVGANGTLADVWKFAADAWTNQTATSVPIPSARMGAAGLESTLYWSATGVKSHLGFLLMFGGAIAGCVTCARAADNDTWVFEPTLTSSATVVPSVVEVGEAADFSATGTGGTAPYVFNWQLGDGATSASSTPSHAYAALGIYTANVTLTDAAGVTSRSTTSIMVLSGPTVTARVEPRFTDVGRAVTYTASASGGTAPYSTRWSFGDGLGFTGGATTHAYASAGTFAGNVTVTDTALGLGVVPFAVTVNATLVIAATAPTTTIAVGENVTFSGSASLGTPPYAAVWTFGDGGQALSLQAGHAYSQAGSYNASLRVTDAVGASRWENFTVQVQPASGSTPAKTLGVPAPWFPWIVLAVAAIAVVTVGLLIVRRRRRRPRNVPLAAAAVGEGSWAEDGSEPHSSESRSSRRARRH